MVLERTRQLQWNDSMRLGIDDIDNQHKKIVEYISELVIAADAKNTAKVDCIAKSLLSYVPQHFAYEERLQHLAGFHAKEAHKTVHDIFIRRLQIYERRIRNGENVSQTLADMLKSWLFDHIMVEDREYVPVIMKASRKQDLFTPVPG